MGSVSDFLAAQGNDAAPSVFGASGVAGTAAIDQGSLGDCWFLALPSTKQREKEWAGDPPRPFGGPLCVDVRGGSLAGGVGPNTPKVHFVRYNFANK